jgi:hypothetical protein
VIAVARAMHDAGAVPMDRDQLAATLGQSPNGGAFAGKVSATRMFGLIEIEGARYKLTELGFDILDLSRERRAKADAFLNVPLYRKVFETYRGRQLPPRPHGLEQAFVALGVGSKQKENARRPFERSARAAGFFSSEAEDRLVAPVIGHVVIAEAAMAIDTVEARVEKGSGPASLPPANVGMNAFIQGLLEALPPTKIDAKADWSTAERAKWLQAAAQIFDLLYTGAAGEIAVTIRQSQT